MSTPRNKIVRPDVLVVGDLERAPQLAGLVMRADIRVASYVPAYAGGASGLGMAALASTASVIVETMDYPIDAKRALLEEITDAVRPGTLVLSSGLAMTAEEVGLGLNGYNPVVAFGLPEAEGERRAVELAMPSVHSPEALARGVKFWKQLGLESVEVTDTPGMVTPRILACIINEAAWALGEGVASAEDIDTAMVLGANHPGGGPLRRADRIGLHRIIAVLQNLQDYYGEERYRPAPALRRLVLQGRLGVEYGAGFYTYAETSDGHSGRGPAV